MRVFRKPVIVSATAFAGWRNAHEITRWTDGAAVFVPRGYDHELRPDSEREGNGHGAYEYAPEFMALIVHGGAIVRIDLHDVIIKDEHGHLYACDRRVFEDEYEEAKDE